MDFEIARRRMVDNQIISRGIRDSRVIEAMLKVPRHLFVQEALAYQAYGDSALPIGDKQTISQPYMVALMTELLELKGNERVLEIGTGSGYQAAILATLANKVCTVERVRELALRARKILDRLALLNVNMKIGDGSIGWKEEAPFDAIIVTAGAPNVPHELIEQLTGGGRLVIPSGDRFEQSLLKITKRHDGSVSTETLVGCRFVKLIGEQGWGDED